VEGFAGRLRGVSIRHWRDPLLVHSREARCAMQERFAARWRSMIA
jgi:hypothetical protein